MNEKADPLSATLLALRGPQWRLLRTKLSTVFSTGRLKEMYQIIYEEAQKFNRFAEKYADNGEAVEFRNLISKFCVATASSCFFGVETNALQEKETELQLMCKEIMEPPLTFFWARMIRLFMPKVYKALQIKVMPPKAAAYIINIARNVIAHRRKYNINQPDFLQALIELQDKMSEKTSTEGNDTVISEGVLYTQALAFLVVDVDSSSLMASFAAHELAANPDVQDKVYEEIRANVKKYGSLSYDALSNMEYFDCVINESLRKYPISGIMSRRCTETYKIPNTDIIIEKNTKVLIPISAIHHDPQYYKNPEKFDPDRFLGRNRKIRNDETFIAFGAGPRMCIESVVR
ncbi:hypothetical protein KM043_014502 [Ampulex compressa]|nr:hypothetical protein KM043_014502 [Ampulex compressa]